MAERAMPSFSKSPPDLVERFTAVMDGYPDAARRKMFGYPAAFVGGNMATGLFADQWVVRLPDDQIADAKTAGAGSFEPMPGKPMKAFVVIPCRTWSGPRCDDAGQEVTRGASEGTSGRPAGRDRSPI